MKKTEYILTRSRRRTIGIRVDRDGNVEVRAPLLVTERQIDDFVSASAEWIEKQRKKLDAARRTADGLGRIGSAEELRSLASAMASELEKKLPRYADALGVSYSRATVRNQKTKWGSCSAKGNLSFNVLLMLAPEEVRDYVIVHELCHIKHMDHSKEFWKTVAFVDPDYAAHRRWLKQNGAALMERGLISAPKSD